MMALALVLLALAYAAKAVVDTLTHQAGNNVFEAWGPWFDARTSWKRKYRDYDAGDRRARFWGSTTVLVGVTDFWHAADSLYLSAYLAGAGALGLALATAGPWAWLLAFAVVKAGGGLVFQLLYRLFRLK